MLEPFGYTRDSIAGLLARVRVGPRRLLGTGGYASPATTPSSRRPRGRLDLRPEARRGEDSNAAMLPERDDVTIAGHHHRTAGGDGTLQDAVVCLVLEQRDPRLGSDDDAVAADVPRDASGLHRAKPKRALPVRQNRSQFSEEHLARVAAERARTHSQPDSM